MAGTDSSQELVACHTVTLKCPDDADEASVDLFVEQIRALETIVERGEDINAEVRATTSNSTYVDDRLGISTR